MDLVKTNSASETLTVFYHSGKIDNYLHVAESVFKEMRATMVKGIWFNRHIKGKYPFEEITPGLGRTKLFPTS